METNQRNLGLILIGFSVLLLIILVFVKVSVDKEETFLCELIDNDPNLDMELCPAHKSNSSWLLLTAFGIAFIILASGFYLFFVSSTKSAKQGFSKVNLSKLDKEEKAIYALLKEKEGSMYQSDLIKETGFSKVKMTRVLDRLTNKKIIDRNRRGMTNIIILK